MPIRRPCADHATTADKNAAGTPDHTLPANAQSLSYQIRYAYRAFVKALAEELGPHRVTTGQWSALRVLWGEEGLSQVELAQRMMVEKASLTPVLKALAAAGLITRTRNADDRRKVNISLTAPGRRLKTKILPLVGKINNRATRRLSPAELHQLHVLLARVMINLQN
ncbi:MAG: MarR family transcriptional regulator [Xanthobacteraceae bacterium]